MTNFTPAQARELALKMGTGFGYTQDATDALHSLADQVETLTAERDALEPVAGAHPTKGTSALAAPVVPAHGAWAGTDEDGNVVCLGMNQSRRFDTPLYLQPTTSPQAAPVAQLSEPPETLREREMAMMLRRIISSARRNCGDESNVLKLANDAWKYLAKEGLQGSPFRDYAAAPTTPKDAS